MLGNEEVLAELRIAEEMNEKHRQNLKDDDEQRYCTFFMKTGSCRYGMHCKRIHFVPVVSKTLLIEHMFRDSWNRNKNISKGYDDALLEIDEEEINKKQKDFFNDVIPEMVKLGDIQHFICCSNFVPHLRGNVFIEYKNIEDSIKAQITLNERHYGGYLLRVQFSLICDWKQAICAYDAAGSCPKYSECNFLHIYKNPDNKFPLVYQTKTNRNNKSTYRKRFQYQDEIDKKKDLRNNKRNDNKRIQKRSRSRDRNRDRRNHRHSDRRSHKDRDRRHSRSHRDREHKSQRHRERERKKRRSRSRSRHRSKSRDKHRRSRNKHRRSRSKDKHRRSRKNRSKSNDYKKHRKREKSSKKRQYKEYSQSKEKEYKNREKSKQKEKKKVKIQRSPTPLAHTHQNKFKIEDKTKRVLSSSSRSRVASISRSKSRSSSN